MKLEMTTYKSLHPRTRARVPLTQDGDARVFLARRGSRLLGAATIEHRQEETGLRSLVVRVDVKNPRALYTLINTIEEELSYLHRRFCYQVNYV